MLGIIAVAAISVGLLRLDQQWTQRKRKTPITEIFVVTFHPRTHRFSLVPFLLLASSTVCAAWQAVPIDQTHLQLWFDDDYHFDGQRAGFVDSVGILRFPGCSEGPLPIFDADGNDSGSPIAPTDGSFQFLADLGDDGELGGDLLIYFSGGGACWDAATCVGSALTSSSSYFPGITEDADQLNLNATEDSSGILAVRPDNPYADFDKIYVPYCTGDVHIGSSDTVYSYPPLLGLGAATQDWTIRHRGFDNLLAVLKWIEVSTDEPFERVTISGSSAGGYGALIHIPLIRNRLGENPEYTVIIDSSNGVLTDGFLDLAFGLPADDGAWGVWSGETIDPLLQSVLESEAAETLWTNVFDIVGDAYRDMRISQSTAAYDLVQSIVLLTMKKVDLGTYDPFEAPSELEIALTALLDWSPKARMAMLNTAFTVPNYRYYLGKGMGHIHLIDPPPEVFPFQTTNYFSEDSARGVLYTDWLDDMLNNPRRFFGTDWKNLSCFPRCLN